MRRAGIGVWLVIGFALAAVFGPLLAPADPLAIDLAHELEPPSSAHLLGTADNGVDVLSLLLHGARLSGTIALFAVGLSVLIGAPLGALAGLRRGWIDQIVTGAADLVQCFPSIMLHVAILALVARPGVTHLVIALVANGWVVHARIARAQALSLAERDFVTAARAIGASELRVLVRHVLPNLAGPLVVQATSALGGAVLAESTLSFLGLGPGVSVSWGALLDQGAAVILRFPHVALVAGSAIALTVLGFNLAGDWLRDRLDPKTR